MKELSKICFVDKNIILSDQNIEVLKAQNISIACFDISNNSLNYNEVESLLLHSPLPGEKLCSMKNCRYIGIRAHNTDYVDTEFCNNSNIKVVGLNKQHGIDAVAEHTLALILGISKNLIHSHLNIVSGNWKWNLPMNYELNRKTVGIVGNGKIGKRVAEIAQAFGLNVLIVGKDENLKQGEVSMDEGLKNADIISIHISSGKENDNFFNQEKLQQMKNGSILINTARGSVLDYIALEKEIQGGRFLGVGLDVFPDEPVLKSSIFQFSNVICTPHLGYLTKECIAEMNNELVDHFINYMTCNGLGLPNPRQ